MSRYGAPQFASLLKDCVLWAPLQHSAGVSGDIDEFPILPSGVTVTNNGTFTKTSLGNNKSVLNFDGSTNYISLTDNDAWAIYEGDFTIACWIRTHTLASSFVVMYQSIDANNRCGIYWSSISGYLCIYGIVSGSNTFYYQDQNFTPSVGMWYHITIQRSGSSCLMYVDSLLKSITINTAFTGTTNIAAPLEIGRYSATPIYTNGNIKDLMIFKGRALSAAEIKLLMNRTHPITGAGLMPSSGEYYRLS